MTRQHEELLERILAAARIDGGIRALALVGSGARGEGLNDEYSDIDLVLVTDSPERYVDSAAWAEAIGPAWFSFSESVPEAYHRERRFLFAGGLDVDVVVVEANRLKTDPESLVIAREICSRGIRVILDKDGLDSAFEGLVGAIRPFSFPAAAEFANLTSDFYFHYLWAIKKCLRGEYWVALQCVNGYLKRKTLSALEWYERSVHGTDYDTRYEGRYLERWIDDDLRGDLAPTFAACDKDGILDALDATFRFFTKVARGAATALSYPFPEAAIAELEAHAGRLKEPI